MKDYIKDMIIAWFWQFIGIAMIVRGITDLITKYGYDIYPELMWKIWNIGAIVWGAGATFFALVLFNKVIIKYSEKLK